MAIALPLTENELRAAMILVTECLGGMGGDRPADLEHDEYTWVDAKMLMAHGYKAAAANATIGALMAKGFVAEYDKDELVLQTAAWQHLDTVWDEYHAASNATNKEVPMTKKTNAKAKTAAKTSRAPKQGSARSNQVAGRPVTKGNPDIILSVVNAKGGNGVVASTSKRNVVFQPWQDNAKTRQLAVKGGSLAKLEAHLATIVKSTAKLARGINPGDAPQSAKAVADQRAKAEPKASAKGKSAKPAAKASKNKQPSRGVERTYTVVKGTENKARPDSWRHHMTTMICGSTSTEAAKAAHAKSGKFSGNKLDFNWAANNGFIKFAK